MPERTRYLAANWKMYKTTEETERFLADFLPRIADSAEPEIVVCPPFTSLNAAIELCFQSPVRVAAQNMHEADEGAYTGEISPPMLVDLGVHGVILGHSERREHFAESDAALARKVPAALGAGLEPILCVGENEGQRDADETEDVLTRQVQADLAEVPDARLSEVVIAYEPIWAIGTGRTATPGQAQEAIALIRDLIAARSPEGAEAIRILYGGSVKPDNAPELISQEGVDGALVGGASLDPADFASMVNAAA